MPSQENHKIPALAQATLFLFASLPAAPAQISDPYNNLEEWRTGFFGASSASSANDADPDGDGRTNLVEYALHTHPLEPDAVSGPSLSTDGQNLVATYHGSREDVIYEVETTSDFVAWSSEGVELGEGPGGTSTATIPLTAGESRFVRLRIVIDGQEFFVPLFSEESAQEPATTIDAPEALYTYFSDRGRDRHAREDQFQSYEHYLSHYWEHRTAEIEIVDTIPKGGNTITFNVRSLWKFKTQQAELRFFYRGIGTVAEYFNNASMTEVQHNPAEGEFFRHYPDDLSPPTPDTRYYTRSVSYNEKERRPIRVGDRMEFELSHFLESPPNGRENYYGTTYLYIVGEGLVPWFTVGEFGNAATEREDSHKVDESAWLGGKTTLHYNYSDEPDNEFMQMATNLAPVNGQRFVLGRRLHHTDFGNGSHDEPVQNPLFTEMAGKLGTRYVNRSCVSCHDRNGRALPPATNTTLDQYVVKVADSTGNPHPTAGSVLQPKSIGPTPAEGHVKITGWETQGPLRRPVYQFSGIAPDRFSVRIAPQLVGLGLLEAIPEDQIAALADPNDTDGDGISGRIHIVNDPETGEPRLGRFGYKAGRHSVRSQVAAAFNTDMGVMTSVFPEPDTGSSLPPDEDTGSELDDHHLDHLAAYVSLLGIRPQRDPDDPEVVLGKQLFSGIGCTSCHTPTFTTSPHAKHAELRDQTIHPYTDLLLHDMGPGLADNLAEGNASGSEWRTPPLWGIGLTAGVSGGEAYLHDGRARTLDEAILWHGGEAESSRQNYENLPAAEKTALLKFLKSL